jgi:hypothetical protein
VGFIVVFYTQNFKHLEQKVFKRVSHIETEMTVNHKTCNSRVKVLQSVKLSYSYSKELNFHINPLVPDLHAWCDLQQAGI